ncbi:hypothetical protein BGZ61DRAFT_583593 [Ilyonectria robusta]|uniref:uncharacterized protein n=1 Tax=Ilyonectria robusta TaxID=1079257 RepID=UPI001E8D4CE5|nr:uncharacterized protein BGZ61DRAFT_583593 [Ilyonectria robusta]KAH8735662.1 hypothetical protein BGZ61DRAFT_583593 [Ilyonectria robusta]
MQTAGDHGPTTTQTLDVIQKHSRTLKDTRRTYRTLTDPEPQLRPWECCCHDTVFRSAAYRYDTHIGHQQSNNTTIRQYGADSHTTPTYAHDSTRQHTTAHDSTDTYTTPLFTPPPTFTFNVELYSSLSTVKDRQHPQGEREEWSVGTVERAPPTARRMPSSQRASKRPDPKPQTPPSHPGKASVAPDQPAGKELLDE